MSIRIGIIEDHSDYRQGLEFLINNHESTSVLWALASAGEVTEATEPADVILLDINMPGLSGLDALTTFKGKWPDSKIIMLTVQEDPHSILLAISRGADGYILKKSPSQKILEAIEVVMEGGAALTPWVAKRLLSFFPTETSQGISQTDAPLTNREQQILDLIVQGLSNEAIGKKLCISTLTVRNHSKNIYHKMQVHSKAQAVARALQSGRWQK